MARDKSKKQPETAEELAEAFDRGEDVSEQVKESSVIFKVNVDFPKWMVEALDKEADRLGIARQAIIKMWIDERLAATAERNRGAQSKKARGVG